MPRRLLKLTLAATALPMLGGCVAAIVPLAAGGAMFGDDVMGGDDNEDNAEAIAVREAEVEVIETAAAAPPPVSEPVAEAPVEASVAEAEPVELAAVDTAETHAPTEAPTLIGPVDSEPVEPLFRLPTADAAEPVENMESTEVLPNPSEPPRAEVAATVGAGENVPVSAPPAPPPPPTQTVPYGPTDFRAYDVLYNYVDLQSRRDPVDNARQSAILAAPGTLSPMRTDCSIRPPAVLIDLDPGDGVFDPEIAASPNPALSQMLASLRLQEVEVFWISQLAAIRAAEVRSALVDSGMDPQGRDQLLLMRRVDDRKQTRRRELSETHCLLAIAGDNRADFDELYLYLKDKSAAQPLEELIGSGWFLTPLPLTIPSPTERPNP